MRLGSYVVRIVMSSGLIAAVTSPVARAGAWDVVGQGTIGGGYDSNVRLSPIDKVADSNGVADASGSLSYRDDAFSLQINPHVLMVRYDTERELNRSEQYLTLQAQNISERGTSSIALSGTQNTTLTSELGSTGVTEVNKKHREADLTVGNSWDATERFNLGAQLYTAVSRYEDARAFGLIDYNYGSAALTGGYARTERSSVTMQASMGKLQVPDIGVYDKTNLSVMLGYKVQFATGWRAAVSFGPSQIRTQGRADSGTVYAGSVSHQSLLTTFNLSLSRDVTPNGFGLLSRREQLRLDASRALSERWTTDWSVTASRNQNMLPDGGIEQDRVAYADLTGNLHWRIAPTWTVTLAAGYSMQRVGTAQPSAERQHAALNISWNGPTRSLH